VPIKKIKKPYVGVAYKAKKLQRDEKSSLQICPLNLLLKFTAPRLLVDNGFYKNTEKLANAEDQYPIRPKPGFLVVGRHKE
jgi:hypothetical protein